MKLNQLSDNQGAKKSAMRVGRGIGSGKGKTSGRGVKGQWARSTVMPGFEGGQMPLYRRLPIRGFNNAKFTKNYVTLNLGSLQKLVDEGRVDAKGTITLETLKAAGVTKKSLDGLKLLGNGKFTAKVTVEVAAISKSAEEKITKAGGKVVLKPVGSDVEKFLPAAAKKRLQSKAAE